VFVETGIVQIAGVIDEAEARLIEDCGVRYLGFPLRLPVHAEDLTEERAARIIRSLSPPSRAVLITYLEDAREIAEFRRALGTRIVQLHGDVDPRELRKLREIDPGLTVIKSLVIGLHDAQTLEKTVTALRGFVDAFITDTFDPRTGASGATGKTHDWSVSRKLVETCGRPVILAGGLTPDNVRRAILEVRPAGVDAHSGVEDAAGRKCRDKLRRFVSEASAAFRVLRSETW